MNSQNSDSEFQPELYLEPLTSIDATKLPKDIQKAIDTEVKSIIEQTIESKEKGTNETVEHLIIFVHGFNNDKNAIDQRGKIIDNAFGSTKVITTAFNWMSLQSLTAYSADQKHAEQCEPYFAYYIEKIRTHNKCPFTQIDFICHSMGNFLFSKTVLHIHKSNTQLDTLFKGSNIIALAADVELTQYVETVQYLQHIVSSWTHYYNTWDTALLVSNPTNKKVSKLKSEWGRAGQCQCSVDWVRSVKWTQSIFSHGYIDDLFQKDKKLREDILRQLDLFDDEDHTKESKDMKRKVYVDPRKGKRRFVMKGKYDKLRVPTELSNGVKCGDGKHFWNDIETMVFERKAETMQLKLQKHKNVDGTGSTKTIVDFARSYGWWSNHVDSYRIILKSQWFNKNKEWEEIKHTNELNEIRKSFNMYVKHINSM